MFILQISNTNIEMHKYVYLDSEVIGVYQDEEQHSIYFLTEKLLFYAYNSKSFVL